MFNWEDPPFFFLGSIKNKGTKRNYKERTKGNIKLNKERINKSRFKK
ncbi:Uncharacterised protein [Helicobacter mustelae]|nr:Uncharacterised protein [Helicobacter mustelae]SQH71258.1 Uncharacterised protein [Helicobacter mustelae]